MKKQYFYIKVEFLDGRKQIFQLPQDLQEACREWKRDHPNNWKQLLQGALINVPSEDYKVANKYQPLMRIGLVVNFFALPRQQKWRSRGQFLTLDNWTRPGVRHFWASLRFLQHDFKWQTRLVQVLDYARWRQRYRSGQHKKLVKWSQTGQLTKR